MTPPIELELISLTNLAQGCPKITFLSYICFNDGNLMACLNLLSGRVSFPDLKQVCIVLKENQLGILETYAHRQCMIERVVQKAPRGSFIAPKLNLDTLTTTTKGFKFDDLIRFMNDTFWQGLQLTDVNGNFLHVNQQWVRDTAVKRAAIVGVSDNVLLGPLSDKSVTQLFNFPIFLHKLLLFYRRFNLFTCRTFISREYVLQLFARIDTIFPEYQNVVRVDDVSVQRKRHCAAEQGDRVVSTRCRICV